MSGKNIPEGLTWPKFRSYFKGKPTGVVSTEWDKYKKGGHAKTSAPRGKKSVSRATPKKNMKVNKSSPKKKSPVKKLQVVAFPRSVDNQDKRFVLIVNTNGKKLKKGETIRSLTNGVAQSIGNMKEKVHLDFLQGNIILDYGYYDDVSYADSTILRHLKEIQNKFTKDTGYSLDIYNFSDYYYGEESMGMLDIAEVLDIKHAGYNSTKRVNYKSKFIAEIDSEKINLNTLRRFWIAVSNEIETTFINETYTFKPTTKPKKKGDAILSYTLHLTNVTPKFEEEDYIVGLEIIVENVHESRFTPKDYRLIIE